MNELIQVYHEKNFESGNGRKEEGLGKIIYGPQFDFMKLKFEKGWQATVEVKLF